MLKRKQLMLAVTVVATALSTVMAPLAQAKKQPSISRSRFKSCGKLEDKLVKEFEKEVNLQFDPLVYQVRNESAMKRVVEKGQQDLIIDSFLNEMKGSPKINGVDRLMYQRALERFMHKKKLDLPRYSLKCPDGYALNQKVFENSRVWDPASSMPGYTAQGVSYSYNMSGACELQDDANNDEDKDEIVAPAEYTSVSENLGSSRPEAALETDPSLIAITRVGNPVTIKFRDRYVKLHEITVMSYLHLKDGSIEHVDRTVFPHSLEITDTSTGKDSYLENWFNNFLPKECKDFHYQHVAGEGDGGSTTGGIVNNDEGSGTGGGSEEGSPKFASPSSMKAIR